MTRRIRVKTGSVTYWVRYLLCHMSYRHLITLEQPAKIVEYRQEKGRDKTLHLESTLVATLRCSMSLKYKSMGRNCRNSLVEDLSFLAINIDPYFTPMRLVTIRQSNSSLIVDFWDQVNLATRLSLLLSIFVMMVFPHGPRNAFPTLTLCFQSCVERSSSLLHLQS